MLRVSTRGVGRKGVAEERLAGHDGLCKTGSARRLGRAFDMTGRRVGAVKGSSLGRNSTRKPDSCEDDASAAGDGLYQQSHATNARLTRFDTTDAHVHWFSATSAIE